MKLSKYRISPGHYRVGQWVIYGGSRIRWQVRDEHDDIIDDFATLREALNYALVGQGNKREWPEQLTGSMSELKSMLRF